MRKLNLAIVNCLDYNGHKNVLFLMTTDDFRYNDGEYTHVALVTKKTKNSVTTEDQTYHLYDDWSVKVAA